MTTFTAQKLLFVKEDSEGRRHYTPIGDSIATDNDPDSLDFMAECIYHFGDLEDNQMILVTGPGENDREYIVNKNATPEFHAWLESMRARHAPALC